jgi:uncharacterized protein YndB with AHSA1/START domain
MIAGDKVTVTVTVSVEPAAAFEVFTTETDLWWRRGVRYRVAGRRPGTLGFEPRLGGRLFEQYESDDGPRTHVAGTITAWEPGARLEFDWRGSNFAPGEVTHVVVTFTATESGGTRVVLEHSGFAALRPDHPVRHGLPAEAFTHMIGMWWSDLLTALRVHALRD